MKLFNKVPVVIALSVAMLSIVALSGCGKNEADMKYLKDIEANDYIDLGEYKGITIDVDKVSVDDAEVEDYVQYYLDSYEASELTDELVKQIATDTGATYQTVDEFRTGLKQELIDSYQQEQDSNIEEQLENKILEASTYKGAPFGLIERLIQSLIDSVNTTADDYGVEPSIVASYYYGVTDENYEEGLKNYVYETLAPNYIMMGAIAQKEGIEVDDKTLDEEIQKMLDDYGVTLSIDEYKESLGDLESYREYVIITKVVEFLKANATINEN